MHLLSSDKISFSMVIYRASVNICHYPSAEIPEYEVFSHPSWALKQFFWKVLKLFLYSVNETQVITQKKNRKA